MSELVCAANQLTGFCIIGVFTETFGTDIKPIQACSWIPQGKKLSPLPSVKSATHI